MTANQPGVGFFELSEETLFEKAKRDVDTFRDLNDHDSLFNAVCTLYHLREWIEASDRDGAGEFSAKLAGDSRYEVLEGLCNAAKHRVLTRRGPKVRTEVLDTKGEVGEAVAGAQLGGEEGYTVDGDDVREHLVAVLREYAAYFKRTG